MAFIILNHVSTKFNYSFDVRGKPLQQARHWSAPEIFGSRAKFNANSDPATLDIEVITKIDFHESLSQILLKFCQSHFRIFAGMTKAYIAVALTFAQVKHKALDII